MKLNVDLSALHRAVAPLGNIVTGFSIKSISGGWIDIGEHLKSGMILGKDIQLDDIDGSEGILHYKGHQVMLYIPDQGGFINQVLADGKQKGAKRVHVAECKTIIGMRERGRFNDRYDVINRMDGFFQYLVLNTIHMKTLKARPNLLYARIVLHSLITRIFQISAGEIRLN